MPYSNRSWWQVPTVGSFDPLGAGVYAPGIYGYKDLQNHPYARLGGDTQPVQTGPETSVAGKSTQGSSYDPNRSLLNALRGSPPAAAKAAPGFTSNLGAAVKDLGLTPQEQNLYQHHLDNLTGPGKVVNPDGSTSTVFQAVVQGPGGLFYNIPTVWGGKILPPDEAAQKAGVAGWQKWPSYATPEEADTRYMKMHDYMGEDTQRYNAQNPPAVAPADAMKFLNQSQ